MAIQRNEEYLYKKNLPEFVEFCKKTEGDWVFIISGDEGSGKSALGVQIAGYIQAMFQRPLIIKDYYIDSLEEYIDKTRRDMNTPFSIKFFDEAVKMFYSRDFARKVNSILMKFFTINRSFQQIHILTIPSPFYIDKYIREWRVRCWIFTYIDPDTKKRWFAFYSRERFENVIFSQKARKAMMNNRKFVETPAFAPDYVATFSLPPERIWKDYKEIKGEKQKDFLNSIEEEVRGLAEEEKYLRNRRKYWKHYKKMEGEEEVELF